MVNKIINKVGYQPECITRKKIKIGDLLTASDINLFTNQINKNTEKKSNQATSKVDKRKIPNTGKSSLDKKEEKKTFDDKNGVDHNMLPIDLFNSDKLPHNGNILFFLVLDYPNDETSEDKNIGKLNFQTNSQEYGTEYQEEKMFENNNKEKIPKKNYKIDILFDMNNDEDINKSFFNKKKSFGNFPRKKVSFDDLEDLKIDSDSEANKIELSSDQDKENSLIHTSSMIEKKNAIMIQNSGNLIQLRSREQSRPIIPEYVNKYQHIDKNENDAHNLFQGSITSQEIVWQQTEEKRLQKYSIIDAKQLIKRFKEVRDVDSNQTDYKVVVKKNPDLKWKMRSILINWMMELCQDLKFKRQTFHSAVWFLDQFLVKSSRIKRTKLQLIAITCLMLASKLEEIECPSIKSFSYSAQNFYPETDIEKMEFKITKRLKWKLNTLNVNNLFEALTSQWDLYITNQKKKELETIKEKKTEIEEMNKENVNLSNLESFDHLLFRKRSTLSFKLFLESSQILDTIICHQSFLFLDKVKIVVSLIYCILQRSRDIPVHSAKIISNYVIKVDHSFLLEFKDFLRKFDLDRELNPDFKEFKMVKCFFYLDIDFDNMIKLYLSKGSRMDYEEFLGRQIHCKSSLGYIIKNL